MSCWRFFWFGRTQCTHVDEGIQNGFHGKLNTFSSENNENKIVRNQRKQTMPSERPRLKSAAKHVGVPREMEMSCYSNSCSFQSTQRTSCNCHTMTPPNCGIEYSHYRLVFLTRYSAVHPLLPTNMLRPDQNSVPSQKKTIGTLGSLVISLPRHLYTDILDPEATIVLRKLLNRPDTGASPHTICLQGVPFGKYISGVTPAQIPCCLVR